MNLDAAKQIFITESYDLLQEMEGCLLRLESEGRNKELLDALFRTAHTIKGSAGLFGLDAIVGFTHVVENVLDGLRNEEIACGGDLAALLLECRDHIGDLVGAAADGVEASPEVAGCGVALSRRLKVVLGAEEPAPAAPAQSVEGVERAEAAEPGRACGKAGGSDCWHISLRFGPDVLRNGMDPLAFIRYLTTMGDIIQIATLVEPLPPLAEMDPESCHLGFEIQFKSEADKRSIESVFDFVREDSVIKMLPPYSRISEYLEHIQSLPGNDARLGELLIASGAITRTELEQGLQVQRPAAAAPAPASEAQTSPGEGAAGAVTESGPLAKKPLGQILVEGGAVQQEVVDAALDKQKRVRERLNVENQYLRVHAGKLDKLINLVGELVISGASTSLLARRTSDSALHESASTMARLVEELRDGVLQLRMVPIGETFNRFQRVVRDVSKELGKDIQLVISGGDAELDKTVVEKISDPLMHLVRNAMDHGIESAELRRERGKPAKGTLRLNAYHDSGSIVIEVSDDGDGLNREKIIQKAFERGMVAPGQTLTDSEAYRLIFEAGFSTADQITNLSGRGVGMDVVRRNIQALRGTVEIESEQGKGTTMRIRLPLTLAIIDGFLMRVGNATYVVPLDMVVECLELKAAQGERDGENHINLRGKVLPFVRLREHFDLGGKPGRRENIVVVQYAGQKIGLVVDELMGELQAVIKPLAKMLGNTKSVSGSTILGSGAVALILDVPAIIQEATRADDLAIRSTAHTAKNRSDRAQYAAMQ